MPIKFANFVLGIIGAAVLTAWSADFEVRNTANTGLGSLRQAIHDANTNAGLDRIVFNIPGDGVHTIQPVGVLPELTDPVVIDGYTQPEAGPNTLINGDNAVLRVHLDGGIPNRDGLVLRADNSIIRGLVITRFTNGISIQSSSNIIAGNFIGTDAAGRTSLGNGYGIDLGPVCCNVIGGIAPADRNLIAGNSNNAIRVNGRAPAKNNAVKGNFIDVDVTGLMLLGNFVFSTISIWSSENLLVGGIEEGARNIIAARGYSAIRIYSGATNTHIIGNFIGVGVDGITPTLGATVAGIVYGPIGFPFEEPDIVVNFARIEANTIAFNAAGVSIGFDNSITGRPEGSFGFTITRNSMFANTNGAILTSLLGRTNDPGDWDSGPNGLQNFPEIDTVVFGTNISISGALSSRWLTSYTVEFFANRTPHPSGFGEGEVYLGSAEISTPVSGIASFSVEFPQVLATHPWITATATDPEGNTSIFSPAVKGRSVTLPLFHVHPSSATSLPGSNITFAVDVTGAEPLSLQWRWNGSDIPAAANASLTLTNVQWEHRGLYSVIASNAVGIVESLPAELVIQAAPVVLTQSVDQIVAPGENVTFFAQGGGALPLIYQWRWNGAAIPGATNTALMLTNVAWTNRGFYTVGISNAFGVTESAPAELIVKVRPIITQQPISQSVAAGESVTLSVVVSNSAAAPLSYRWRSNSSTAANITTREYTSFFRVADILSNATYSVVVSNAFGPPGVLSANALISVLPDGDRDGLPDAYETAHGLSPTDPADAMLDADGDGLTNRQEYSSGTDPLDRGNALKVSRIDVDQGLVRLEFFAASNKTYSVQFQDVLNGAGWRTVANLAASRSDRTAVVMDERESAKRFYRLVTPAQP